MYKWLSCSGYTSKWHYSNMIIDHITSYTTGKWFNQLQLLYTYCGCSWDSFWLHMNEWMTNLYTLLFRKTDPKAQYISLYFLYIYFFVLIFIFFSHNFTIDGCCNLTIRFLMSVVDFCQICTILTSKHW